jgi:uncharacterized membrane protein
MAERADVSVFSEPSLRVPRIGDERPWLWLARGWEDIRRAAPISLGWGLIFLAVGVILVGGSAALGAYEVILPLAAGFPLLAPVLVVGLYEVSRRLERSEAVEFKTPLRAWQDSADQIAMMGFVLGFVFLAWMRIATLLYASFFGTETFTADDFLHDVVLSRANLMFLLIGSVIGAALAFLVFAISVISLPLLLDREVSVTTAIATSVAAVRTNPRPLLLWALLIVLFTAAGLLTVVGLVLTLPLIAHATWHAYRDLVASTQ